MSGGPAATSGPTRHVIVMGVSGCGKSAVAAGIADALGWEFSDADDFHPAANVEKMRHGIPLTDADRMPWLRDLAAWLEQEARAGRSTVMACSALRRVYRDVLRSGPPSVELVHLHGPVEVIEQRMEGREHFMPPSLLQSQVETLEPLEPDEAGVVLDLQAPLAELVARAVAWVRAAG